MASPGIVRRALMTGMFLISLLVAVSQPLAAARQDTLDEGPVVNLELILDSSGSMSEEIEPGLARIDAAKQVLNEVITALPQAADVNVGIRVYGHKGSNTEAGRAESCLSSELMVPILGVDSDAMRAEIDAYQPVGWTPLALSLTSSELDFQESDEGVQNHVVLLTDGLETCGGDPCSASRQLKNGPKAVTTHVIGFALAPGEQESLQCVVDASGGSLQGASSAGELRSALFLVLEQLDVIKTAGFLEIESIDGVFPLATATRADDSGTVATETTFSFTTANTIEIPAGSYAVTWTNPSGSETRVTVVIEVGETTFIRGSMLRLPSGDGEIYEITAVDGTVIWADAVEPGDVVWVLPGAYRLEVDSPTSDTMILSMVVQTLPGAITEVTVSTEPSAPDE